MRQHPMKLVAPSAAALVVVAAILASAGGGPAASGNICNTPSIGLPLSAASCVTEIVSPHFIGSDQNGTGGNGTALSFTKFHNEAGPTGATASHVVLTVTFPTTVTVVAQTVWVAAPRSTAYSQISSSGCTHTATTASCPAGNIPGDGRARMIVQFTTNQGGQLKGEAQYGEGGGNPSNPPNDDQVNYDTLTYTTSASGGCFDLSGTSTQTVTFTTAPQQTQAVVGQTNDTSLPCTYADTGVLPDTPFGHTRISFVEFPTFLNNGYALVRMILTPVPQGFNLNKSPIFEDTSYAPPFFGTSITVPNCDRKGNLVGAEGTPVAGQTDPSPVNDSCVSGRFSLGKGNGEIDLHVFGSPADGHYSG
jgi:hypothetical protein